MGVGTLLLQRCQTSTGSTLVESVRGGGGGVPDFLSRAKSVRLRVDGIVRYPRDLFDRCGTLGMGGDGSGVPNVNLSEISIVKVSKMWIYNATGVFSGA